MSSPRLASPPTGLPRSEKIAPRHHDRLAVVYVRQSTMQQVLDHQESTRLQYGLVARAQDLGWAAERIAVIDDDLGQSGASAAGRVGACEGITFTPWRSRCSARWCSSTRRGTGVG